MTVDTQRAFQAVLRRVHREMDERYSERHHADYAFTVLGEELYMTGFHPAHRFEHRRSPVFFCAFVRHREFDRLSKSAYFTLESRIRSHLTPDARELLTRYDYPQSEYPLYALTTTPRAKGGCGRASRSSST